MRFRHFLIAAAAFLSAAWAQDDGTMGIRPDEPFDIDAERVERADAGRRYIATGSVRISQPGVVMTAQKIEVFVTPDNEIERIIATGRVRYANVAGDAIAGKKAIFAALDDTLTVLGDVVVLQGPQVATADRLTYNTQTGSMVMSTEPGGRVRGLFARDGET